MKTNAKLRALVFIAASLIVASGLAWGGSLIGTGLAARNGNAITVTGSAKTSAVADNTVWSLTANENASSASSSVKKVEKTVLALKGYLMAGGVVESSVETGAISTYANNEYVNGNLTGRVLSYTANQSVTVRSNDVQLIQKLSNGIGALLQTGVSINNSGPAYYVSNLSALRPQLLAEAMKDAKLRAQSITSAVGGKVGTVLSVTSGPVQVTAPDSVDTSSGGMYDTTTIPKTVTVTVSVAFKTSN